MYLILLFLGGFLFLTSCSDNEAKEEKKINKTQVFNELAYLNKHNNINLVYRNTSKYFEISEKNKVDLLIDFRSDLFNEDNDNEYEANLKSWFVNDTVHIVKTFFIMGSCNEFYPYLEYTDSKCYLLCPEIVDAEVSIENHDTSIFRTGCDLVNIIELRFKIPKSDLKGKKLFFEGKEILYN